MKESIYADQRAGLNKQLVLLLHDRCREISSSGSASYAWLNVQPLHNMGAETHRHVDYSQTNELLLDVDGGAGDGLMKLSSVEASKSNYSKAQ
ncbi:hypothetical protein Tco_1093497 [Tanacetum coccineum]|uniref:Uncharacterized protein n=1 Tax=Tanacetum coccineum TaxID=301880 RepID=A0ABQ5IE76_9ASTR